MFSYTMHTELPRKRTKVSRACDACRRKKIRCDVPNPEENIGPCASCLRLDEECIFSRVPLKRGPTKGYMKELEVKLKSIKDNLIEYFPPQGTKPETSPRLLNLNDKPASLSLSPPPLLPTNPSIERSSFSSTSSDSSANLPTPSIVNSNIDKFTSSDTISSITENIDKNLSILCSITSPNLQVSSSSASNYQNANGNSLIQKDATDNPISPQTQTIDKPGYRHSFSAPGSCSMFKPTYLSKSSKLPSNYPKQPSLASSHNSNPTILPLPNGNPSEPNQPNFYNKKNNSPNNLYINQYLEHSDKPQMSYSNNSSNLSDENEIAPWIDWAVDKYYSIIHPSVPILYNSKSQLKYTVEVCSPIHVRNALLYSLYECVASFSDQNESYSIAFLKSSNYFEKAFRNLSLISLSHFTSQVLQSHCLLL